MIIITIASIVAILLILVFFYGFIVSLRSAPFIPIPKNDFQMIIKHLQLQDDSVFCDLGSGDGRVIEAVLQSNNHVTAIGYEINPYARFASWIRLRRFNDRAKVFNTDLYKANLKDVSHIFMYLIPSALEKLEPLFNKQLTNTRVVSVNFKFPHKQSIDEINVSNPHQTIKKLYVYEW